MPTNLQKFIEEKVSEFSAPKERCIATDGEYTDKEMVEILSNHLKSSYKRDTEWLPKTLQSAYETGVKAGQAELVGEEELDYETGYRRGVEDGLPKKTKQQTIQWIAEYAYKKANPDGKMDVPSIVYEQVEKDFNKFLTQSSQGE